MFAKERQSLTCAAFLLEVHVANNTVLYYSKNKDFARNTNLD